MRFAKGTAGLKVCAIRLREVSTAHFIGVRMHGAARTTLHLHGRRRRWCWHRWWVAKGSRPDEERKRGQRRSNNASIRQLELDLCAMADRLDELPGGPCDQGVGFEARLRSVEALVCSIESGFDAKRLSLP